MKTDYAQKLDWLTPAKKMATYTPAGTFWTGYFTFIVFVAGFFIGRTFA